MQGRWTDKSQVLNTIKNVIYIFLETASTTNVNKPAKAGISYVRPRRASASGTEAILNSNHTSYAISLRRDSERLTYASDTFVLVPLQPRSVLCFRSVVWFWFNAGSALRRRHARSTHVASLSLLIVLQLCSFVDSTKSTKYPVIGCKWHRRYSN